MLKLAKLQTIHLKKVFFFLIYAHKKEMNQSSYAQPKRQLLSFKIKRVIYYKTGNSLFHFNLPDFKIHLIYPCCLLLFMHYMLATFTRLAVIEMKP